MPRKNSKTSRRNCKKRRRNLQFERRSSIFAIGLNFLLKILPRVRGCRYSRVIKLTQRRYKTIYKAYEREYPSLLG